MNLLNVEKAALVLGVTVATIRNRAKATPHKLPPFHQIGKTIVFVEAEIAEWVATHPKELSSGVGGGSGRMDALRRTVAQAKAHAAAGVLDVASLLTELEALVKPKPRKPRATPATLATTSDPGEVLEEEEEAAEERDVLEDEENEEEEHFLVPSPPMALSSVGQKKKRGKK